MGVLNLPRRFPPTGRGHLTNQGRAQGVAQRARGTHAATRALGLFRPGEPLPDMPGKVGSRRPRADADRVRSFVLRAMRRLRLQHDTAQYLGHMPTLSADCESRGAAPRAACVVDISMYNIK